MVDLRLFVQDPLQRNNQGPQATAACQEPQGRLQGMLVQEGGQRCPWLYHWPQLPAIVRARYPKQIQEICMWWNWVSKLWTDWLTRSSYKTRATYFIAERNVSNLNCNGGSLSRKMGYVDRGSHWLLAESEHWTVVTILNSTCTLQCDVRRDRPSWEGSRIAETVRKFKVFISLLCDSK